MDLAGLVKERTVDTDDVLSQIIAKHDVETMTAYGK